MDTHCPFYVWLCQSVPVIVAYPPFDDPHMLTSRGTCHDRTQFLLEPCQVVKQNLSHFIHEILHERFHPALLRPVHFSLCEGSFGLVMLLFIMQIILFRTDCLLSSHKFTLHGLENGKKRKRGRTGSPGAGERVVLAHCMCTRRVVFGVGNTWSLFPA
jgi:hypothetical protein